MRKIVVTGVCGFVVGRVLEALRGRYDLVLLDVKDTDANGKKVEGVKKVDLMGDRQTFSSYFRGAEAVIHSARQVVSWSPFLPKASEDSKTEDERFRVEIDNLKMLYNVYKTCAEEGVRRAIVMGSNHATDFYEVPLWRNELVSITPDMLPLSNNTYGWSRACWEHLGHLFAAGLMCEGTRLENIQLRIGNPKETGIQRLSGDDFARVRRLFGSYLSPGDQLQLIVKSIEAPDIRNEYGVPFQIFYGVSANSYRYWDIGNAVRVIGYQPQDDSGVLFRDKLVELLGGAGQS
jgi:uronate dehydrogenase